MTEIDPRRRAVAAWALLVARATYAYNWYDIGGVLPLVGQHFAIGTVDRGVVLAAFLLGAAIFQLPAGYAAMRWGNALTSVAALGAMAAFALASGVAPTWLALAAFRFGAGAGAAFFFAPALGLVTSYYPVGQRGFMIGAYNGAFSVGSAIGLFASAYLGPATGWAFPLALGGLLLVGSTATTALLLPRIAEPRTRSARELWHASRPILRSRGLWALALGGTGLWGGYYIAAQYFVNYATSVHASWSLALAAAAPTLMIVVEVVAGPIGGWFGERSARRHGLLAAWGLAAGFLLISIPWLGLDLALLAFAILGFTGGVTFALLYLIPTFLDEMRGNTVALGLALINFVQILLGSALAIAFAEVAASDGYDLAWLFAGIAAIGFLPALFAGPADRASGSGRVSPPAPLR